MNTIVNIKTGLISSSSRFQIQAMICLILFSLTTTSCKAQENSKSESNTGRGQNKYNVLFIAVDDLNDYVSVLRGFPGVKMPNLGRFAQTSINFSHAYAAAPVCNPSRIAVLTGLKPLRTGCMNNGKTGWFQGSQEAVAATLLPEIFHKNGYTTMWSGKIFHTGAERAQSRPKLARLDAMWDDKTGHDGGYGPFPQKALKHTDLKWWDWQAWTGSEIKLPDARNTEITIKRLQQDYDKPFFIALGLYRPHTPWVIPKRFLDMHPPEAIQHPQVPKNDLEDIPLIGKRWAGKGPDLKTVKEKKEWKTMIRGYLSAISYTDYNIGRVLDALNNSPYKNNTIVVLWADNGLHLGEKHHFGKNALWEQDTHVMLMIRVPGMKQGDTRSQPVSLLDIYPTLVDLCDLPQPKQTLDGLSLVPVIKDKNYDRKRPAISYYHRGSDPVSTAIRTEDWRYIRYHDGTEELYNEKEDPNEWDNLANQPKYNAIIQRLSKWLPK